MKTQRAYRFVETSFRLYPKTGLSFFAQKKWMVSISDINTSVTLAT